MWRRAGSRQWLRMDAAPVRLHTNSGEGKENPILIALFSPPSPALAPRWLLQVSGQGTQNIQSTMVPSWATPAGLKTKRGDKMRAVDEGGLEKAPLYNSGESKMCENLHIFNCIVTGTESQNQSVRERKIISLLLMPVMCRNR